MGKIKEALESHGIQLCDIPAALVVHEVIGLATAAVAWVVSAAMLARRSPFCSCFC